MLTEQGGSFAALATPSFLRRLNIQVVSGDQLLVEDLGFLNTVLNASS